METDEYERACRVCNDRSDGAHFGIDACRACAAFFRRSVTLEKQYVCRQGGDNCDINKSVRCMCRKCRLRKCIEAGMLLENIQSNRDPIVPRRTDPAPLSAAQAGTTFSQVEIVRPSPNNSKPPRKPKDRPARSFSCPRPKEDATDRESPQLLNKIIDNYKQLCNERRATELATDKNSLHRLFDTTDPLAGMTDVTLRRMVQIYSSSIPFVSNFVANTFEEFQQFDETEKWAIFKSFMSMLLVMEAPYRSYKLLPLEQALIKKMCSMTTYLDYNNTAHLMSDVPNPQFQFIDLSIHFKTAIENYGTTVRLMDRLKISEHEFAALIGLAVFNPGILNSSAHIADVTDEMRGKIFDQLHMWYRFNNIDNYSRRFGQLMCIFSYLMKCTSKMKEDLELFKLMDIFTEDSRIYDLINS